ncbi:ATP-binding cassette G family transporter ABCG89 [Toxoplasma gondii MAS]|uniref:ATP-binding cassette G family transporter ABCG89 n=1 Tax=Toxoplasma gondii MAS TaxID=943118 RepID=A0A086Q3L6_TOXGO|nr:ATP-binding cassette G family transporter ABCG89 [Toxoplasma gondii MAS]
MLLPISMPACAVEALLLACMLCTQVVLMSEGHLLYCGDREACIGWFAHLGQVCEADMNPAEFLIKVTAVTDDNREAAVQRTVEWAERWRQEGAMFLEQWEALGGRAAASSDQMRIQRLFSSMEEPTEACAKEAPGENGAGPGGSGALVETKQPGEVVSHAVLVDQSAQTSEADRPETQNAEPTLLHRKLSSRAQYMLKGGAMSKACLEEMKTDRIGVLRETWLQIQRSTLLRGRDPFSTYVRLVTTVISALIPALMYYRLTWQSSDAWNKVSSSFYIILSESMACLFGASMAFNKERAVIQREYESGVTRMPLYFIGRITADSLLWMFFPFIYHLIVYWISDLGGDSVSKYFASLAITLLLIQVVLSYTYVVVALIKHPVASTVVLQIMQMILTLFSGFMVKLDELGKFWIWIVYLSPFKYALPCFTVTIFWNTEISSPSGSTVSGVDFLNDTFGFQHDKFWLYVGLLFVLGISGRLLGMVALSWKASRTKENQ